MPPTALKPHPEASRHHWGPLLALALVLFVVAQCGVAVADAPLAALVTDTRGKVEILRPGQSWASASVMAQVPAGSQMRVSGGSHASLSFVRRGLRVELSGPTTAAIEADGVHIVAGAPTTVRSSEPTTHDALAIGRDVNIVKMGGVRVRGDGFHDQAIMFFFGPSFLTPTPTLRWRVATDGSAPENRGLHLTIEELQPLPDGSTHALNPVVDERFPSVARDFKVPPNTLQSGKRYRVAVRFDPPDLNGSEGLECLVLDDQQRRDVQAATDEAEKAYARTPSSLEPLSSLTWIYVQYGLDEKAMALAERILKIAPGAADVRLLLAELYRSTGCNTMARQYQSKP